MKKLLTSSLMMLILTVSLVAIPPYLKVGNLQGNILDASKIIAAALEEGGFELIGQYSPGDNPDLFVIVYTSEALKSLSLQSPDRGMLAAALKVGVRRKGGTLEVSMLNPEYLFYAYFREKMEQAAFRKEAIEISDRAKSSLKAVGSSMTSFGGDLASKDLMKYKYMVGMQKFDDPVKLAEFNSFNEAVSVISRNLKAGKAKTRKVYEIIDESENTAVFGVGLLDSEMGEAHFLPIIGEDHLAAMPYEIIVQGGKVTMLHGRFRFALHWPELTMKTFTKIMSSPGDVKDMMEDITR